MKTLLVRLLGLMAGSLLLAHAALATVSTLAYYRLGENDPGAAAGRTANAVTIDSGPAGVNLYQLGVAPTYLANTGVAGSTLCLAVDGGGFTNDAPIQTPSTNWGIEAWVLAASTMNTISSNTNLVDGYAQIAFNGNSGAGGMGLYSEPGGMFIGLCGGVGLVGNGAPIVPDIWTHLAMICAGGETTFYVNGVANGSPGPAPDPATNYFGIGLDPSLPGGWEEFQGSVDEVRVFAFKEGAFTTNDLLLTHAPPPLEAPTIFAGPTVTPAGALVSGTEHFAAGTPFSLGVMVGGSTPVSYQWQTTTNLTGATNATLSFAGPTTNNSGNYKVVVSNALGAVTSAAVSVAVLPVGTSLVPIAYYRLGENDPHAVAGQPGDSTTIDIINGLNLAQFGTPPVYDSHTGVAGSTLCIDVDGGGYATNTQLTTPVDSWGMEAWVKASNLTTATNLDADGLGCIVYNGNDGLNGMGIFQNGDKFVGLCAQALIPWVPAYPGVTLVVPGQWMHLALVATGGTTTLYVNGISAGSVSAEPNPPLGSFSIGGSPYSAVGATASPEDFQGSIDEVRVFGVMPGQFSVSGLLLTGVPPGAEAPAVFSGPTASSSLVAAGGSFTVSLIPSGTTPLYYQWYQAGVALSGQTNATLELSNVKMTASGGYDVVISNPYGSTTSAVVNITVLPAGVNGVTPVAYYRLGEDDPGAAAGRIGDADTIDIVNGINLSTVGAPSTYSSNTGARGSTRSMAVNGGGYSYPIPIITNASNWGLEAWAYSTNANVTSGAEAGCIVLNGALDGAGLGIYQNGNQWAGLNASIGWMTGPVVVTNTWTHLAVVTTAGATTFYVNGEAVGTSGGPNAAVSGGFSIGYNNDPTYGVTAFQGLIDEVRAFTVTPGLFSTNNLLLASVPPALTVGTFKAGPNIIVLWTGENLQQAGAVSGPWTTISDVTAPWVVPETGAAQFFRSAGQP